MMFVHVKYRNHFYARVTSIVAKMTIRVVLLSLACSNHRPKTTNEKY